MAGYQVNRYDVVQGEGWFASAVLRLERVAGNGGALMHRPDDDVSLSASDARDLAAWLLVQAEDMEAEAEA